MFRTMLVHATLADQKESCVCEGGISSTKDNTFWQRFFQYHLILLIIMVINLFYRRGPIVYSKGSDFFPGRGVEVQLFSRGGALMIIRMQTYTCSTCDFQGESSPMCNESFRVLFWPLCLMGSPSCFLFKHTNCI